MEKATYTLLAACLLIGVCISGYQAYSTSDRVVLNKLYENIETRVSNDLSISNPMRWLDGEKDVVVDFRPYGKRGGDFRLKKLKTEKDPERRQLIMKILPNLGCSNCVNELLAYAGEDNYRMKLLALTALHDLKYEGMHELLYETIEENEHEKATPWSIFLLAEIGDESDCLFTRGLSQEDGYQSKSIQRAINMALREYEERGITPCKNVEQKQVKPDQDN